MAMDNTDVCFTLAPGTIAELCGVDVTTGRRWKRGGAIPEPARRLLELLTTGELTRLSRQWRGWWLDPHRGVLLSPELWTFTPGDVRSLVFLRQRLADIERRDAPFPDGPPPGAQHDWIDGQWRLPVELTDRQRELSTAYAPQYGHRWRPWAR